MLVKSLRWMPHSSPNLSMVRLLHFKLVHPETIKCLEVRYTVSANADLGIFPTFLKRLNGLESSAEGNGTYVQELVQEPGVIEFLADLG